jgi:hypothetical protein
MFDTERVASQPFEHDFDELEHAFRRLRSARQAEEVAPRTVKTDFLMPGSGFHAGETVFLPAGRASEPLEHDLLLVEHA